jgi:hypothetical protein
VKLAGRRAKNKFHARQPPSLAPCLLSISQTVALLLGFRNW